MVLNLAMSWALAAQDSDFDGLPDAVEEHLGTDPQWAEPLELLAEFPTNPDAPPEKDIIRVRFGNVAKDRWLWALYFAAPYTFDNALLILYLDADHNPETGRAGMGCEVMLSHRAGTPGVTGFAPDGTNRSAPAPRVALVEGVLYLCADGEIHQQGDRSVFRFTVLSETLEPYRSVDSTGWTEASGPGNSERKKVLMLDNLTQDENFDRTEGLDLIWALQADGANIVLSSVEGELEGFRYYDAEYRWPAVYGSNGTITVTVPRGGTFYPAVVVYDTSGAEAYELRLGDKILGRFVAAEDDNRQRLYVLREPLTFRGGEKLTLWAGSVGRHITEDLFLLAQKPPLRGRKFELSHLEAGYVPRNGGQMRVTWITTWPTACTLEYGLTADDTNRVTEEAALANHRLYLTGLQPGATYHYRIIAPKPDGTTVVSGDRTFTFQPPPPFEGTARQERIPLTVENPYDFALENFPITSGVPFARGELGDPAHLRLLGPDGTEVAMQAHVTARWQDGSIKWVLLSFLANAGAHEAPVYTLEYGTEVARSTPASPLRVTEAAGRLTVETGALRVEFDAEQSGFPTQVWQDGVNVTGDLRMGLRLADDTGRFYTTHHPPESLEVEEVGPVRTVIKTTGHFLTSPPFEGGNGGSEAFFAYINRFVFYASQPFFRVYTTWGNDWDGAEFAHFQGLDFHLPLAEEGEGRELTWTVGLSEGEWRAGQGPFQLQQVRDDAYTLTTGATGQRAPGWLVARRGNLEVTVAVRDFWQLYPKSLGIDGEGLTVGLCPDFPEGTYDGCSKLDEIKLYYYLRGGKYKIRRGVQKQHELLLAFHRGDGDAAASARLARAFQEPLLAVCPPERYCGTGVFGEILPATPGRTEEYEQVCERVYQNTVAQRDNGHEFGMLNFGDQWGERKVNWANGEYDHHHAFLMQFIRTGDRRWYFLGEKAARHAIDVDTCHYGPDRGGEWLHCMGHTGGYFDAPYEGEGIPQGYFSPSHTWTEGFCDWYFLSGDPTAAENASLVADYYDGAYLNHYDWSNCRDNGWHLLLTLAAYRANDDPFYLNAARIIVERTLERQTPGGGWHRQMVPGHCYDMPRHRGEANFMLGVLANGLEEYYREVPDQRVAEAIIGGARQAWKELWVDEVNGFRYTSCPNMTGYTANNDMTAEILFFAHRLRREGIVAEGDEPFGEIALRAMKAAFEGGIGSIAHLRWTPHLIFNMDLLAREGQME